ncbi:VWA domain-containing protein, partial [bacterium]|nr:VWA domain-containing protein [bacterium]
MFRGFVLHQRTAVLLGIFLMFTVTHADQIPLVGVENINNFAQHSAVGPNQMCYYAEAGSSTIQIFDKNLQIVGSFSVLSKDGIKLPVYSIRYENELFISTATAGDIHVYAVDPQTGKATYRYTERSSGDNSPKKITLSSSNRIPMDPAYESWKEERHAEGNLDAIVSSLCNTLVCVQIDEDGDFNIGTADGTNLLYRYPNDPWSSDIRIYVNGAFWELTNEAGICGGPTAQFINWTNDGTSIHCTYSIATTLPLVDVEVIHTPVMFGAAAGAILTETIVTNTSIEPLEVGVLYEYDTDVDMDDNARLFLGPNEQLVETCHDAPYSASYWDAVPASGTIVGRGTFSGAMAVTPDWMAFGQWDDFQNTCWERTCDGEPYGDSAVLYRWNAAMLGVDEQRRAATYYGVGEIVTEPGELQLSIVQPDIQCEAFGVRPDPFTLIVNVTNTGASPCSNVSVNTVSNGGPGGSATILGANPITIGTLNPGANAAVSYEIDLSAAPEGGCVLFDVFASSDDCADNQILDFCVDVPPCVVEPGECCLDIVFAVDTTGSMAEAIDNIRTELPNIIAAANAASGGDVRLGLVTFGDEVRVVNGLTFDQATVSAGISALMAASGGGEPEASDEALREIITHNGQCTYGNEFIGEFRENCEYENVNLVKLIILITDARPAGCNDLYEPGVDDVNAHARALDAAAGNILITPIFVPTYFSGPFETTIETIMTDYATTTGGHYTRVNANGSGTGEAITDIIENCGEPPVEDECGGPSCNTSETMIGYAFGDAPILDATIRTTSSGMLVANWSPLPEANFYQLYWNYENDSP